MWNVPKDKLRVKLPEGFSLKEDEDLVYLFYKDKQVASFSSTRVSPWKIEEEAKKFLKDKNKIQVSKVEA